jgi:hypothetical protein
MCACNYMFVLFLTSIFFVGELFLSKSIEPESQATMTASNPMRIAKVHEANDMLLVCIISHKFTQDPSSRSANERDERTRVSRVSLSVIQMHLRPSSHPRGSFSVDSGFFFAGRPRWTQTQTLSKIYFGGPMACQWRQCHSRVALHISDVGIGYRLSRIFLFDQ